MIMITRHYFALAFSIFALASFAHAQNAAVTPLKTVASVDLQRYSGKWYEIARYPNKFQKQCVANVTADYSIKPTGKLEVLNECMTKDGTVDSAKGEAKVADKVDNSK